MVMLTGTIPSSSSSLTHSLTHLFTSFTPYNPSPTQTNNEFLDNFVVNRSINSHETSYEGERAGNSLTSPMVVMAPVGDEHSNLSTLFQITAPTTTVVNEETEGVYSLTHSPSIEDVVDAPAPEHVVVDEEVAHDEEPGTHSYSYSLTQSLTYSLTYSYSLTHSLTHLLTYSCSGCNNSVEGV